LSVISPYHHITRIMNKLALLSLILLMTICAQGQKITGKLSFSQGQAININLDVKTTVSQEVMGQAIDFNTDGSAIHTYKVTNSTSDNTTFHHTLKRVQFNFEAMGQKKSYDSNNPSDLESNKFIKETLAKTYDMIVDPSGKVLMVQPETIQAAEADERMKFIASMLKDITDVVLPPKKGDNSFFKILPDREVGKGDSWVTAIENEMGKLNNIYTIRDITDSTIIIDLSGTSTTNSKMEIMTGMEVKFNLNNKTTGQITLDRATGIARSINTTTESNGTSESMGTTTPITARNVVNAIVTVGN